MADELRFTPEEIAATRKARGGKSKKRQTLDPQAEAEAEARRIAHEQEMAKLRDEVFEERAAQAEAEAREYMRMRGVDESQMDRGEVMTKIGFLTRDDIDPEYDLLQSAIVVPEASSF